ncbi:MAG: methylenetetrahydrofolate reductase C-terminal domain-containing protein [Spirochaetota bacterium]|nr:methylenetetrahydrofolate reductase C-terminal domain-containing protein [Spirochaetota bacterium]
MIIGELKPIDDILSMISDRKKILIVGCKGCVTVCSAGGQKEVEILSSTIQLARKKDGNDIEIREETIERQCDTEYLEELRGYIDDYDAVLSMACGAGVQFLAEKYRKMPVYPALNTNFIGVTEEQGVWTERCQACGGCVLDKTGGICPITRCSKSLLNGPCGGSSNGKCEIDSEIDCGWQLIYDRLKELNLLDIFEDVMPIKDWSVSRDGGPRSIIREDLKL